MGHSHGFELMKEQHIVELDTDAWLYRHVKTGAELLSLSNRDENKVFGIIFRTPPSDSTGVPHIMEHAVLSGSRKYRAKEPFVELLKGSLKTFVNAFTSPDKTSYPLASQNLQDFYNLIDVYLDAVFYPLIQPHHLEQEGWHYELTDIDASLVYRGIVFNEMKGAYSSPEDVLFRRSKESLFPDTTYRFDSGGNPTVIPELTYEQFKAFHKRYYHPSNARLFFYGDDPVEERLRLLNAYLQDFEPIEVDSAVSLQAPFTAPQKNYYPYSVDKETDQSKKGYMQMNWALPERADPTFSMILNILSYAVVGTQASPLRKTLIDSGLGDDVTGGGLSGWGRQMVFNVGMKGIDLADVEKLETLILDTLSQLAQEGIEPDMIEAAVNSIEFALRENNTGSYPRGLALMMRAATTWIYDGDPLERLAYEAPLTAVKKQLTDDPGYLQSLIQTYLLENTHRTTIVLEPDPHLNEQLEAAEKEKLAQIKAGMSQADLQLLMDRTQELQQMQATPDSPEVLAAIPRLTLADLDKENKTIPLALSEAAGSKILYHDLFTNGIVYLHLGFDMRVLSQELLPYISLFGSALLGLGTEHENYVKLSQRIDRKTGGISTSRLISAAQGGADNVTWFFLRGKATVEQTADMLDIMRDVLLTVKLDNRERFRQLLLRAKAGIESHLTPAGHSLVNTRLGAHLNQAAWLKEQMGGIDNLFFLRDLITKVENDWPGVLAKLEEIRHTLLNRQGMICNVTLDEDNWQAVEPQLHDFLTTLPMQSTPLARWTSTLPSVHEGLTIPAQVNYVGKGINLYALGYELHGSIFVISHYVRLTHLWERVRAQGGAYGAYLLFDRQSGVLNFLSYRDPNLLKTVANFDETADFLRQLQLSEDELVKSIIGVIGSMDSYQLPDAKGYSSMVRYLTGVTDALRQQRRDEVLSTTTADFRAFADVLDHLQENGRVVVMGSPEAIAAANESQPNWLKTTKVM